MAALLRIRALFRQIELAPNFSAGGNATTFLNQQESHRLCWTSCFDIASVGPVGFRKAPFHHRWKNNFRWVQSTLPPIIMEVENGSLQFLVSFHLGWFLPLLWLWREKGKHFQASFVSVCFALGPFFRLDDCVKYRHEVGTSLFVLRTAVLVTFVCIAYIGARERNQELLPTSPDMPQFLLSKQGKVCQKHLKCWTVFSVCNLWSHDFSCISPGFYFFVQESILNYLWAMMWVRNSDQKAFESWNI